MSQRTTHTNNVVKKCHFFTTSASPSILDAVQDREAAYAAPVHSFASLFVAIATA